MQSGTYEYRFELSSPIILETVDRNGGDLTFRVSSGEGGTFVFELIVSEKPLTIRAVDKAQKSICEERFNGYIQRVALQDMRARAALSGLGIEE